MTLLRFSPQPRDAADGRASRPAWPVRAVAIVLDRFDRLDASRAAGGRVGGAMRLAFALFFLGSAVLGTVRALSGGGLPGPAIVLMLMFAVVLMMNRIG